MDIQAAPALSSDLSLREAQGNGSSGEAGKIQKAGRDFESILLGSWLQGAEDSFASVPGTSDDEDSGSEQLKGIAVQQLAASLAGSGGIGLGKLITEHLSAAASTHAGAGPPRTP